MNVAGSLYVLCSFETPAATLATRSLGEVEVEVEVEVDDEVEVEVEVEVDDDDEDANDLSMRAYPSSIMLVLAA